MSCELLGLVTGQVIKAGLGHDSLLPTYSSFPWYPAFISTLHVALPQSPETLSHTNPYLTTSHNSKFGYLKNACSCVLRQKENNRCSLSLSPEIHLASLASLRSYSFILPHRRLWAVSHPHLALIRVLMFAAVLAADACRSVQPPFPTIETLVRLPVTGQSAIVVCV